MPEVDLYKRPPIAKTYREVHLENLLRECLPDLIYVENGTRTNAARRSLIAEIQEILK